MNGKWLLTLPPVLVAAAAILTCSTGGASMGANADTPVAETLPEEFRGYWEMAGPKEKQLPAEYAAYRFAFAERPAACVLYKYKGLSRAILAEGARVKTEGKQLVVLFQYKDAWSVAVTLRPPDKGRMAGKLVVTEEGKEVFNADVVFVKSTPPS